MYFILILVILITYNGGIFVCFFLECKLIKTSTILFYSITNSNQMKVHLLYNNMIIQCINDTWGIDFWDDTLPITSTTSK